MKSSIKGLLIINLIITSLIISNVKAELSNKVIVTSGKIRYQEDNTVLTSYGCGQFFKDMSISTIAKFYDIVQARASSKRTISQVKQIKPEFKALLYRHMRVISNSTSDEWQQVVENDWILKDINGKYVEIPSWPGHFCLDIGNPDYQVWVANRVNDIINEIGYDGVFADESLRIRATDMWPHVSSRPVNPRTGTYWTDEEVKQAVIQQFRTMKTTIGSRTLVANGIWRGNVFFSSINEYTEVLSNSLIDGFVSEGCWFQYKGEWMSENDWINSLNMLTWLQNNFLIKDSKRLFIPIIKLSKTTWKGGGDYPLPPDTTKEQMMTYAFTSTLLGAERNQTYLFTLADVNFTQEVIDPLFNVDIGSPLGSYYIIEETHVYSRDFSKVKILVNPTSDSYTVNLGGTFETITGERISEITMEPFTGVILLKLTGGDLLEDGFESGSLSDWSDTSVSTGETATVVNTLPHHGSYSIKSTSNGGGGSEYAYVSNDIPSSSELYGRGYFYVSQSGIVEDGDRMYFMMFGAGSTNVAYAGWRKTGGVVKWTLAITSGTSTAVVYSSASPMLNRWYSVELRWKKGTADGVGELWVDGAKVCSLTDTNTGVYGDVDKVRLGVSAYNAGSITTYSDCFKVATSYIGLE